MSLRGLGITKLPSLEAYDDQALEERSTTINGVLEDNQKQRKISSRSINILRTYQQALLNLSRHKDDEDTKEACLEQIMSLDEFIETNEAILNSLPEEHIQWEARIDKLQMLEFYATYGDYFAYEVRQLKEHAEKEQIEDHQLFRNYWTKTAKQLEAEKIKVDSKTYQSGDEIRTCALLLTCAESRGTDVDNDYTLIQTYATRNQEFHNKLDEYIQGKRLAKLAELLHNHGNILAVSPPANVPENIIRALRLTISNLQKKFFTIRVGHENSPEMWEKTDLAFQAVESQQTRLDIRNRIGSEVFKELSSRTEELAQISPKKANTFVAIAKRVKDEEASAGLQRKRLAELNTANLKDVQAIASLTREMQTRLERIDQLSKDYDDSPSNAKVAE